MEEGEERGVSKKARAAMPAALDKKARAAAKSNDLSFLL